jgi:hypothetical protein
MRIDFLYCLLRYLREAKDCINTPLSTILKTHDWRFSLAVGFLGMRADIPRADFLLALFLFWVEGLALFDSVCVVLVRQLIIHLENHTTLNCLQRIASLPNQQW